MKNISILLLTLLFLACEEIPPEISPRTDDPDPADTTSVDKQERQVLIEEFTGVRCVNCPAGSEAIKTLKGIYGEQLVVVSIHAGSFAPPYPESRYDFQTSDGNSLLSYLGEPLGYPTAVVNRKLYDGEFDLQLGQNQWPGFVAQESEEEPVVRIGLERTYEATSRDLLIDVTLLVQETIEDEDVRLTVLITEDNVADYQLTPNGKQSDYNHQHILRDIITTSTGDPVNESFEAGAQLEKSFDITLDPAWKAADCRIVAFVHLNGEQKDVLQAHEVEVVE